jgi:hypothetical protein
LLLFLGAGWFLLREGRDVKKDARRRETALEPLPVGKGSNADVQFFSKRSHRD